MAEKRLSYEEAKNLKCAIPLSVARKAAKDFCRFVESDIIASKQKQPAHGKRVQSSTGMPDVDAVKDLMKEEYKVGS